MSTVFFFFPFFFLFNAIAHKSHIITKMRLTNTFPLARVLSSAMAEPAVRYGQDQLRQASEMATAASQTPTTSPTIPQDHSDTFYPAQSPQPGSDDFWNATPGPLPGPS
ncbi:hypothetical protein QBC42DRAFT_92668 [Cladorrhinum samala]|uniref:Uncharacterized protein n=1 Tax=Cladorrhinum samala TaxID=585594 RepID=A0AAV9HL05_9PEZI|nr:hypothetical protein QBC42DRAFT_92668 [Cladorrhinum samala]